MERQSMTIGQAGGVAAAMAVQVGRHSVRHQHGGTIGQIESAGAAFDWRAPSEGQPFFRTCSSYMWDCKYQSGVCAERLRSHDWAEKREISPASIARKTVSGDARSPNFTALI
jgi:hypothetical protein